MTAWSRHHATGVALMAALGGGLWALWLWLPRLLAGTLLQDIRNLAVFLAGVALLSLAEMLWSRLTHPRGAGEKAEKH
jgi:hypothetical protein